MSEITNTSAPIVRATAAPPTLDEADVAGLSQDLASNLRTADAAVLAAVNSLASVFGAFVVDADGRTITAAENGTIYSNEGASAIDPFILPGAAAGLRYSFIVQDADGIRVTAASGDTIRVGASVSGAAGKIEATAIGSAITIVAVNATEWIAVSNILTWTTT